MATSSNESTRSGKDKEDDKGWIPTSPARSKAGAKTPAKSANKGPNVTTVTPAAGRNTTSANANRYHALLEYGFAPKEDEERKGKKEEENKGTYLAAAKGSSTGTTAKDEKKGGKDDEEETEMTRKGNDGEETEEEEQSDNGWADDLGGLLDTSSDEGDGKSRKARKGGKEKNRRGKGKGKGKKGGRRLKARSTRVRGHFRPKSGGDDKEEESDEEWGGRKNSPSKSEIKRMTEKKKDLQIETMELKSKMSKKEEQMEEKEAEALKARGEEIARALKRVTEWEVRNSYELPGVHDGGTLGDSSSDEDDGTTEEDEDSDDREGEDTDDDMEIVQEDEGEKKRPREGKEKDEGTAIPRCTTCRDHSSRPNCYPP